VEACSKVPTYGIRRKSQHTKNGKKFQYDGSEASTFLMRRKSRRKINLYRGNLTEVSRTSRKVTKGRKVSLTSRKVKK
jgi:hypothetical protein